MLRPLLLAALLLASTLAAAVPGEAPPASELLVEGHTVFLVLDGEGASVVGPLPEAPLAGASSSAADAPSRFPGVLWFNDQYLVEADNGARPLMSAEERRGAEYGAAVAVLARTPEGERCGGAILAVNHGDPDPRQRLLSVDGRDPLAGDDAERAAVGVDTRGDVTSDGLATNQAGGLHGALVDPDASWDYHESYRVTDPNGYTWIVDKYRATTRVGLRDGTMQSYGFPVWVANLHGLPAFTADAAAQDELGDCVPERSLVEPGPFPGILCRTGFEGIDPFARSGEGDVGLDADGRVPGARQDDPCFGYAQPSRAGFCYGGQPAHAAPAGCTGVSADAKPLRRYHALLYFRWHDLRFADAPRDHADPATTGDTNGCQRGTEWPCPENGRHAGDAEGNSHPAYPRTPPHDVGPACPVAGSNPTNHGGSTWGARGCDYAHATARVDVYYSANGRPPEPAARWFAIEDSQGSSAAFHDFSSAYPGTE